MSEGDWSSEARGLEPQKKRIPMWVWGCGGGCALVLLVGVILGVFVFKTANQMMNQEKNWADIDRALPVAEQPEGYFVMGMPVKFDGVQMWMLTATDQSHQVLIWHGTDGEGVQDTRDELFGAGAAAHAGAEFGTLVVQGRELRTVHYRTVPGESGKGGWREAMREAIDGANVNVELSLPEDAQLLALTYTRQGASGRVPEEDVLEFLAHFRLPGGTAAPLQPEQPEQPAEPVSVPPTDEKRDG